MHSLEDKTAKELFFSRSAAPKWKQSIILE